MFAKKTKLQLCARNLTGVEHDLVDVTFTGLDLAGAVNNGAGYAIGTTSITVDAFTTVVPTGCVIGFAGDDTTYYVSSTTGSPTTSITIDPPLRKAVLDNVVVTIYPHFDITEYWTNDATIEQRAEFTQAELILDKPIKIELFNKNSIFYDRDTHSTGWGLTTSYFSTYNAQAVTDNQYIRISLKRNGTWYQKYNGKIKQHTLVIDEINKSVSFEAESVFYGLKDSIVSEIDELYYLHKYTTSTRKTKTPSGRYVDVIRALFKYVGVLPKSYTVTNIEKSYSGAISDLYNYCVLTVGAHNILPGELITVDIDNPSFDGTHIVYSVTSTTITYYFDSSWEYFKDDVNATVAAGGSSVVLQTGLGSAYNNFYGKCKFATADTQVYDFVYTHSTKTIVVDPVLTGEATINEDVYLSCPKLFASQAGSGTVTAHRIYFDLGTTLPTDYFNVTHQGHAYNLLDLFWITEKWMVQDVEAETGFSIFQELCLQLGSCANLDYIDGIAYGFFRSKINTSSSKITLTRDKIIGDPTLNGNWQFYSVDGVIVKCEIKYWDNQNLQSEFCYVEDLASGDYQRYLSETPTTSVKAYERLSTSVCLDSFNNIAEGDRIVISGDDTIYKVTAVSGEQVSIHPPLRQSAKLGSPFSKVYDSVAEIQYANCLNIKLKYPNIFLTDGTNKTIRKYWNNATATLGIHPMSFYTSAVIHTDSKNTAAICVIKNIPVSDGFTLFPNGDLLLFSQSGTSDADPPDSFTVSQVYSLANNTPRKLQDGVIAFDYNRIVCGYVETNSWNDEIKKLRLIILKQTKGDIAGNASIGWRTVDMLGYGEVSEIEKKQTKRGYGSRLTSVRNNQNERTRVYRNSKFSSSGNGNEFLYYKIEAGSGANTVNSGLGSDDDVYSIFLNSDVLNPDYDDKSYSDMGHAECIQKTALYPVSQSEVLTGTPPTAATVRNFIVNHGEGANQEYYYCISTDGTIAINSGTAWASSTVLMPDISGTGGIINVYAKYGMSSTIGVNTANVKIIRKAYDNLLVVADPTGLMLMIVDVENDRVFYIEDTTVLDSIGDIDIQCFTNWYDYQGATNATIFENDVCFNASKLAYKFYSKNRRPYEAQARDVDLGYLDYTLFDRMTIDSTILSAASGSPKFYVYGYRLDCRTHDHKLTLLESVE